jgi:hypothetical protein
MLVVAAIMFYILELIMEIVPNYPTYGLREIRTIPKHKCLRICKQKKSMNSKAF